MGSPTLKAETVGFLYPRAPLCFQMRLAVEVTQAILPSRALRLTRGLSQMQVQSEVLLYSLSRRHQLELAKCRIY